MVVVEKMPEIAVQESPKEKLREREKNSRFVTLLGDPISLADIKSFIKKDIPVIERYMEDTEKRKSAQKKMPQEKQVPIRETNTLMHTTLLDTLNSDDPEQTFSDINLSDIRDTTPREWRMLLGILDSARSEMADLKFKGDQVSGLKKAILKIEDHLDSTGPNSNGWTIPIYDKYGVVEYVQPDHNYRQARIEKNK